KRIADAIVSGLRDGDDLAVRYGGEEFLILLPDTDLASAVRLAERVRRRIEDLAIPNEGRGGDAIITASFGVAAGPTAMQSFSELLSGADIALYAAKRNGRNQVWPPLVGVDDAAGVSRRAPKGDSPETAALDAQGWHIAARRAGTGHKH
ncbi:MAG: diguanylate cyclase, partial [Pseudomonadota bacterium]|nr:diguanylate cyclase [Pseudomonadota bacterium]